MREITVHVRMRLDFLKGGEIERQTDRATDRETDGQIDRQRERKMKREKG